MTEKGFHPVRALARGDHFFQAILGGAVLLIVIAAASVAWVSRQPVTLLPADSPAGVVQRYYLALENKDYDQAYNYLSYQMDSLPVKSVFVSRAAEDAGANNRRSIRIGETQITDDQAVVTLYITHYYGSASPFSSDQWTNTYTVTLIHHDGGWYILKLPYMYY